MQILHKITQVLAYKRYEGRGKSAGFELDDWFKTESSIMFTRRVVFAICSLIYIVCGLNLLSFNKYLILLYFLLGGLLIINAWQLWKPERFSNFITATATIIIALATLANVNISKNLEFLEGISIDHNTTALQVEFRPYVVLQLQNQNKLFNLTSSGKHIKPTIESINVGKVPALDVHISYDTEQKDVHFEIEDANDIAPDRGKYFYNPDIYVGNSSDYDNKDLYVTLLITYRGNTDVDPRRYCTESRLTFRKLQSAAGTGFALKSSGSKFGFINQEKCLSENKI